VERAFAKGQFAHRAAQYGFFEGNSGNVKADAARGTENLHHFFGSSFFNNFGLNPKGDKSVNYR
jgi:hypothetical protein